MSLYRVALPSGTPARQAQQAALRSSPPSQAQWPCTSASGPGRVGCTLTPLGRTGGHWEAWETTPPSNKRRTDEPQPRRHVPRGRPASEGATFWRLEGTVRPLATRRPLGTGGPNHSSAGSFGRQALRQREKSADRAASRPPAGGVGFYSQRLGDLGHPPSTLH